MALVISCDNCAADLTDAGPKPTYKLTLSSSRVPNSGGSVYAIAIRPPINRDHHFCGKRCLAEWAAK